MLDHHDDDELIILKDKNKRLIDYTETLRTYEMRVFLEGINQSLARTRIALDISDSDIELLKKRLRLHPDKTQ